MLECTKKNSVVCGKGMKKRLNLWVHEITTYKKKVKWTARLQGQGYLQLYHHHPESEKRHILIDCAG